MGHKVPLYGTKTGIKGDGLISLILCAIALILAVLGDRSTKLSKGKFISVVVIGGLVAIFGLFKYGQINDAIEAVKSLAPDMAVGFGVWVSVLAGLILMVVPIVLKTPTEQPAE